MARNFYYGPDASIVSGSANFAALITAAAADYGLTSAQATAFSDLNTALQAAYSAAIEPSTRTRVTIEAKNIAIQNMRAGAIPLAKIVYATATVDDSQLIALGLLPRPQRTPVPAPGEAPVIDVVEARGNTITIRLHGVGETRGKPAGVDGASVFSYVGATAPATEDGWNFEGVTSRTKVEVTFPSDTPAGAKVWFTAFWFNERKQNGPAAAPVSTNMPGGSAMAA